MLKAPNSLKTLCLIIISFFLLTGMGGKPQNFASVTATSISDREILTENKPFIISFSEDMVEENKLNLKVTEEEMPFIIKPHVDGDAYWVNPKSFSFQAKNGFPRGHEYRIILKEKLLSLAGKHIEHYFSFSTQSLEIERIFPQAYDASSHELALDMAFNLPVPQKNLGKHIEIKDPDTGEVLKHNFRFENEQSNFQSILIELEKYRPQIELIINPDQGAEGLGLMAEYKSILKIADPKEGTDVTIEHESEKGRASDLNINSAYAYDDSNTGNFTATFYLNTPIDQADYQNFIIVDPPLPVTLNAQGTALSLNEGLEPHMNVSLSLLPGLQDSYGRVLDKKVSYAVSTKDRSSRLSFLDPGTYLSPEQGESIGLEFTNIDTIYLTLTEVYDNNLPVFLNFEQNQGFGKEVASHSLDINEPKNNVLQKGINIAELADKKEGVFLLNISTAPWSGEKRKLVVLTDIALIARKFDSSLFCFASSISTGKPIPYADIKGYSPTNQLLFQGKTDARGFFSYKNKNIWEAQEEPAIIIAQKNQDKSVLALKTENYRYTSSQIGERPWVRDSFEAYLYTPRGVFKPGEKVDIKSFVRDAKGNIPKSFPVELVIRDFRNAEMAKIAKELSSFGGADFSYKIPETASSGFYSAELIIPGQENKVLGFVHFNVEDFVAPRLEVKINSDENFIGFNDKIKIQLGADYLFGLAGKGLNYELGFDVSDKAFRPKKFKDYSFGDEEANFNSQINLKYLTGKLDEKGLGQIEFAPLESWLPSALLQLKLIASVQEDTGRWVTATKDLDFCPNPFLLGMKITHKDELSLIDEASKAQAELDFADGNINIKAIALSPEEELINLSSIRAELVYVDKWWNTVWRDGRYIYTESKKLVPIDEQDFEALEGQINFSFQPDRNGTFIVRLKAQDKDGNPVKAAKEFYFSSEAGSYGAGSGRMDIVELNLDKKTYMPGDRAKLEIKAPYQGTLLLALEQSELIETQLINLTENVKTIEIPVRESYRPNLNISAWVVRPVEKDAENWYSHRAFGETSLVLSHEDKALKLECLLPDLAKPSAKLEIPFEVKDAKGKGVQGEFSVALVDEGILSLSSFATPDPLAFFYASRFSAGSSFDMYDALLRPELQIKNFLKPGGGMAAMEHYQGSLSPKEIHLSGFIPTVVTDKDGQGLASFDLPEYSGKARLMVVGASKDAYASSSNSLKIGREMEVEINSPRVIAPGDEFPISFKVFSRNPESKAHALVRLKKEGPISLPAEYSQAFVLSDETREIQVKAKEDEGLVSLKAEIEIPGEEKETFTKSLEILVRSPYPSTSAMTTAVLDSGEEARLKIDGDWILGRAKASLSLDNSPLMSIIPALEFINASKYSGLENFLAKGWTYLTLPDIQEKLLSPAMALSPEDKIEVEAGKITGEESSSKEDKEALLAPEKVEIKDLMTSLISQLLTLQGFDGSFSPYPGVYNTNVWQSINASFFLHEAKAQVSINQEALDNSLRYLNFVLAAPISYFDDSAKKAYTCKAYAAFVLTKAGLEPLSWLQHLSNFEGEMQSTGKIYLAAAKALVQGNAEALKALEGNSSTSNDDNKPRFGSSAYDLALRLYVWSLLDPKSHESQELFLKNIQNFSKHQKYSPAETAILSLGLSSYTKATGLDGQEDLDLEIKYKDQKDWQIKGSSTLINLDLSKDLENKSLAPVEIKNKAKSKLYAGLSLRAIPLGEFKAFSSGKRIEKKWFRENDEEIQNLNKVSLEKGERIRVEISLHLENPQEDIVISDLSPGGMKIENPRLSEKQNTNTDNNTGYLTSDIRDDRLLIYLGKVNKDFKYSYTLRALYTGAFIIPPLAAEAIDDPRISALGEKGIVYIK